MGEKEDFLNLLETEPIYEDPSLGKKKKKLGLKFFHHAASCLKIIMLLYVFTSSFKEL